MKRKKGSITLIVMLVGVVVFLVVAGLIGWRFDKFVKMVSSGFKGVTMEVRNKSVSKAKRAFCKNICRNCCFNPKSDTEDCRNVLEHTNIEVGDQKISCTEVIDCKC